MPYYTIVYFEKEIGETSSWLQISIYLDNFFDVELSFMI